MRTWWLLVNSRRMVNGERCQWMPDVSWVPANMRPISHTSIVIVTKTKTNTKTKTYLEYQQIWDPSVTLPLSGATESSSFGTTVIGADYFPSNFVVEYKTLFLLYANIMGCIIVFPPIVLLSLNKHFLTLFLLFELFDISLDQATLHISTE